ncbi:MAG TPA: flagellar biosynthesis anti-sigma factor FlgM [Holophaga sp.]|nr:flagellar biosynthesis anti-sigma factor FlgM [Holophaga sp.]
MRVTSKPSSPGAAPVKGTGKPVAGTQVSGSPTVHDSGVAEDALSVSSTAQFIAVAEAEIALVPDIRMDKVGPLKVQLESDHYHPDGEDVAKGIVKEYTPPEEP